MLDALLRIKTNLGFEQNVANILLLTNVWKCNHGE